jgi:hypothetical protein
VRERRSPDGSVEEGWLGAGIGKRHAVSGTIAEDDLSDDSTVMDVHPSALPAQPLVATGSLHDQEEAVRCDLGLPDWQSRRFAPPGAERVHDLIGSVVVDRPARKAASSLASGA